MKKLLALMLPLIIGPGCSLGQETRLVPLTEYLNATTPEPHPAPGTPVVPAAIRVFPTGGAVIDLVVTQVREPSHPIGAQLLEETLSQRPEEYIVLRTSRGAPIAIKPPTPPRRGLFQHHPRPVSGFVDRTASGAHRVLVQVPVDLAPRPEAGDSVTVVLSERVEEVVISAVGAKLEVGGAPREVPVKASIVVEGVWPTYPEALRSDRGT